MARIVAVTGAVLMPASLFLDWYKIEGAVFEQTGGVDGWDMFEMTDAVLVLAAVTVLVLVAKGPPYLGRALLATGGIATAVVAVQLINKPKVYGLFDVPGLSLQIGAWLGLLGAVLILAAGTITARGQAGLRASNRA